MSVESQLYGTTARCFPIYNARKVLDDRCIYAFPLTYSLLNRNFFDKWLR